jgi:hypothetical protein
MGLSRDQLGGMLLEQAALSKLTKGDTEENRKQLAILKENIQNILDNNKLGKPKLMFSGGVDSLSLWAILDSMTGDYILHANDPDFEALSKVDAQTAFKMFNKIERAYTNSFIEQISKKYWGYELTGINHTPTAHIVGFWGDEIMLRNPDHIDILAKHKGTTAVPTHCWKVIYIKKTNEYMAFLFNNNTDKADGINNNKVDLVDIEKLTGFKFK